MLDEIVDSILLGLEEFFDKMVIAKGNSAIKIFLISLLYLVVAIIGQFTNIPVFVDIKSALLASAVLGLASIAAVINRLKINKYKKELNGGEYEQEYTEQ